MLNDREFALLAGPRALRSGTKRERVPAVVVRAATYYVERATRYVDETISDARQFRPELVEEWAHGRRCTARGMCLGFLDGADPHRVVAIHPKHDGFEVAVALVVVARWLGSAS